MSSDVVKLDVGGTVFKTTKTTLTKFEGFFRGMFESGIPLNLDKAGCVFIDRCPIHFHVILNFMRDGKVVLPESEQKKQEILHEAEYYALEGLIRLCHGIPPGKFVIQNRSRIQFIPDNVTIDHLKHDNVGKNIILIQLGGIQDVINGGAKRFVEKYKDKWDIFFNNQNQLASVLYIHMHSKNTACYYLDHQDEAELFEEIESLIKENLSEWT